MGTTLLPPFATAGEHRDQAMAALAQANRVRLRRASLMRWMHGRSPAESHDRAAELTLEPDPRAEWNPPVSAAWRLSPTRRSALPWFAAMLKAIAMPSAPPRSWRALIAGLVFGDASERRDRYPCECEGASPSRRQVGTARRGSPRSDRAPVLGRSKDPRADYGHSESPHQRRGPLRDEQLEMRQSVTRLVRRSLEVR